MRLTTFIKAMVMGLFLVSAIFNPAAAQDAQPTEPSDDDVNRVASTLYCPVCENMSLDVCPTQACAQWRDIIRQKLTEGWTNTEIQNYFVAQYGDRVLPVLPRTGLNWLIYILPPLFIFGGALILFRSLRSMRAKQTALVTAREEQVTGTDDPYLRRLEEDLKRRKD